jgi:hypothetical protein
LFLGLEQFYNEEENGGNVILFTIIIIVIALAAANKTNAPIYINDVVINVVLTFKHNNKEAFKPSKVKKAKKSKNGDNNKYVPNKDAKDYNKNKEMLDVDKDIVQNIFFFFDNMEYMLTSLG